MSAQLGESVCPYCGVGCRLRLEESPGLALRIRGVENAPANRGRICAKGAQLLPTRDTKDRLTQPQIKQQGQWSEVSWEQALQKATEILSKQHDAPLVGLLSPSAATEEHFLAQRLIRGLGSNRIDHRLREQDFSDDARRAMAPPFEMKIAELENAQSVLLLGCNIRHEAPILGHRLRKAWQRGAAISVVNPLQWDFVFGLRQSVVVAPQFMLAELAGIAQAVGKIKNTEIPARWSALVNEKEATPAQTGLAELLINVERSVLMLGQFAMAHHQAAALRELAAWVAQSTGSALNLLPHGSNSQGAWLAGAVPHRGPGGSRIGGGDDYSGFRHESGQRWLLWDIEPEYDCDHPAAVMQALRSAHGIVAASTFVSDGLREVADVLLPYAPLVESEGSTINLNGDTYHFAAAGRISGEARPGWKILRQLGGQLQLDGFSQVSLAGLQDEMNSQINSVSAPTNNGDPEFVPAMSASSGTLFRIGEVPMFSVDALCRRSDPLQATDHADSQFVGLNPKDAHRLGLIHRGRARVRQGEHFIETEVRVSDKVPAGAAWLRSATCQTRELGHAVGPVSVEVA